MRTPCSLPLDPPVSFTSIATRTDSKNRLDPPHDSDKHCIWLEGFVCASTDFSKKNRFFFVFMIGNGRHQALFVGKLYDGLKIPEKMAGFAQKTRGIGKESVHSVREAFARSGKMPSVDCGMLA